MSMTSENELPQSVASWLDPEMDSVKGTETPKDPNKGYIALLGWSVNAIKAAQKFDRRYIEVAPNWAADFCTANKIPFIPRDFRGGLRERGHRPLYEARQPDTAPP